MASKQVLVMKQFPKSRNLRTGKYVAQGSHASVGALLSIGHVATDVDNNETLVIPLKDPFVRDWVVGSFKKIVVSVETDEELKALEAQARELGLPAALICDAGHTEFNGVPTLTALGIGPADEDLINKVTGHLPLF